MIEPTVIDPKKLEKFINKLKQNNDRSKQIKQTELDAYYHGYNIATNDIMQVLFGKDFEPDVKE